MSYSFYVVPNKFSCIHSLCLKFYPIILCPLSTISAYNKEEVISWEGILSLGRVQSVKNFSLVTVQLTTTPLSQEKKGKSQLGFELGDLGTKVLKSACFLDNRFQQVAKI
jgi:hypothetical protein